MKGKNISGKKAFDLGIGGIMTGFGGMLFNKDYDERVVANTKGKDFTVDTSFVSDTGCFETGIESAKFNNGDWVIVDEYKTKAEAKRKHLAWVKFMKTNPKKLKSIHTDEIYKEVL